MRPFLLPAKDPQAVITIPFEFGPLFTELEDSTTATIASATVTASVFAGVDPNPSALMALQPDLSKAPRILQRVTGGIDGVTYLLTACATIGETHEVIVMKALLPVSI